MLFDWSISRACRHTELAIRSSTFFPIFEIMKYIYFFLKLAFQCWPFDWQLELSLIEEIDINKVIKKFSIWEEMRLRLLTIDSATFYNYYLILKS